MWRRLASSELEATTYVFVAWELYNPLDEYSKPAVSSCADPS